jgi:hypothetical protein
MFLNWLVPKFKENLSFHVQRPKSSVTVYDHKSNAVIANHAKSLVLVLIENNLVAMASTTNNAQYDSINISRFVSQIIYYNTIKLTLHKTGGLC